MAIVDDHGRFFGRVNLVDAFLGLLLLALIPLGYGAYMFFKTPAPRLTAVEPATLTHGDNLRVTIRGENLRPYMRVSFGDRQGRTFLFNSATSAEVDVELSPGVYDVVLYDYAQERSRLPKALTITAPPLPTTQLEVVGAIRNILPASVKAFTDGMTFQGIGTVVRVGAPVPSVMRARSGAGTVEIPMGPAVDVPMVVRVGCYLKDTGGRVECVGGGVALQEDAFVIVRTPLGELPFQIDLVRSPVEIENVEVRTRFVGDPEALALMKPDDIDEGARRNPLAGGAKVVAIDGVRRMSSTITVLSGAEVHAGEALGAREATLLVPAQRGTTGWRYAGEDLRAGSGIRFRTASYDVRGSVLRLSSVDKH